MSEPVINRVIRSKRVVLPEGVREASIFVSGETVHSIEPYTCPIPPRAECTDFADAVILPGLVDTHVHINQPGRTEWEGFATATRAAAAGGVTTVVDMPLNCLPVTTTVEALELKRCECEPLLWVDMGFWGGVVPDNLDQLTSLAEAGVLGAKAFLCDSGIPEFPESDEAVLRTALRHLGAAGVPLLAHAEIDLGAPDVGGEPSSYARFEASRPPSWEVEAIALLIKLCRETGSPVHIVHLSAADALPMIREARNEGLPLTVETCPHYLTLSSEEISDGDTEFKCAPPIRGKENQDALWEALREGTIDMVTTDHSPCTPGLKCKSSGSFDEAWGGVASLQLGLPLVWTEARNRGFTMEDLARWMCEAPAKLAGLSPRKGTIAPGADADFVAWQPDALFEVAAESLYMRHKLSPYLGRSLSGRVVETILRGSSVFADEAHQGSPAGKMLRSSHAAVVQSEGD